MASRPSSRGRAVRPVQLVAMMVAFLLIAVTGGVLTAGLLLPAVGSVGAVGNATTDLFDDIPTEMQIDEPSEQSVMLDADGNVLATFFAENRIVVGFDEISEHMKNAVVAVEDHRFYDHGGVDPEGILRATVRNIGGGDLEGASTLTQQYVKNVQIEESRVQNDPELYAAATETSIARKLREARYAIALEQVRTKDEILTGYLNIAQFGPSQWGVEAAAHHYFNKTAAELNIAESAVLARITQNPAQWDPVSNPENAERGRNTVLRTMLREGFISQAEYDEAVAIPIADMLTEVQDTPRGCAVAGNAAYFCQYVVNEILLSDAYGETVQDRRQLLNRGGLTIHTTLDPHKQQAAFAAVTGSIPIDDPSGISMALPSIEPGTGRIFAMAQNTNYGIASEADPRATQVNYNVGQAHGGGAGFHAGSTFKVFTLVQWLREGNSLMDRINSTNRFFPREDWEISCGNYADDYEPKNLEGFGGGVETVLEATRTSVNTSFVVMAQQMDLCDITGTAHAMGVRTGDGSELLPIPSMILGTNNVTPLSMANAYATLAAGGVYCEPVAITSMVDRNGEEIPVPPSDCQRVLEEDIADGVNYALQEVMGPEWDSTGSPARIPPRPTAGKTGTANDAKHAWFIGYTPQMASAVWMGYADADEPMIYKTINGRWVESVYGGLIAAPTWKAYMLAATENMPIVDFDDAPSRVLQGEQVRVPSIGGQTVEDAQRTLEEAGFDVRMGYPVDSGWPEGLAVATTPTAGSSVRRGETVTIYTSGGRDASRSDRGSESGDDGERRGGEQSSGEGGGGDSGREGRDEDDD